MNYTFFSPDPGKEVVRWCDACDEVYPCCDSCVNVDCGHYSCKYDKRLETECWCRYFVDHPVNNCPVHGREYFDEDRKRVKDIFTKRWLKKQASKDLR